MNVVWFKRDLRVRDHQALATAVANGNPVIGLYIYEPIIYQAPEFDVCHLYFLNECLAELRAELEKRGGCLLLMKGEALSVFDDLHHQYGISHLWSHEEAGNTVTFQRDIEVKQWAEEKGVVWTEYHQNGVVRRLQDRDGWAGIWHRRMEMEQIPAPELIRCPEVLEKGDIQQPEYLGIKHRDMIELQVGGEAEARRLLHSFLTERGMAYTKEMSSPVTAYDACSRISAHISYGCLSVKTAYQEAKRRSTELSKDNVPRGTLTKWRQSIRSLMSRLRWHCHFMQRIEDQPDIDEVNIARVYDGIRGWDEELYQAWKYGRTGYPMVDACMRSLRATGWLNFRMRAMVMSFASYHLWLDWRKTGVLLAQYFVDYEPGIHWSQVQMQSGTTGINSVRIYSPIKQVEDQDPAGTFIKKWVPELENLPNEYLAEPHLMPEMEQIFYGLNIGGEGQYPQPIVDHKTAYKKARDAIFAVKSSSPARAEAKQVFDKHGSRRRPRKGK